MTEPSLPVADAAGMLRSATASIAARPPRGVRPALGTAWSCFTLLRVVAGHLATGAPTHEFPLYYEIEVRAWLAKHAIDQAPSAPPLRRPMLPSWVAVGAARPVVEAIVALAGGLRPVLLRAAALLPDRPPGARHDPVDFTALDRAVLDQAVLGPDVPDHGDLDLRALDVAATAAGQIATALRDPVGRGAASADGP